MPNPDTNNTYNAQHFGNPSLDEQWVDSPFSEGTYEQEQNPMLGEMPGHPLHVKIVDTQSQNVAAEFTAWTTLPLALAGSAVATQICPHRYHRDSARLYWYIPTGCTVWVANKPDPLSNPNPPASGFALTPLNNSGQMVYEGQQPLYAVYTGTPTANPTPSQPAVPASGVAAQNTNSYPVTVVVSGGTATQTTVNGVVVGPGDGTYVVPAYGSIAVTYTVAPAWVWSNASPAASTTTPFVAVQDQSYGTVQ
jgi:hypothetical protein